MTDAAAAAVCPFSLWTLERLLPPLGANLEVHAGLLEVGRREMPLKHCDSLNALQRNMYGFWLQYISQGFF